ncbi:MAG: N-acetyltransferase [Chlorobium limicola]|uniref:acyltransferase n=1 Tax=Chlorobium limicola TaxID=1092 RepID=UPI0023F0B2C5|nr:DapH/DapD/GlmU-related protein [Chlorobium limicola]NTV08984.1 N-acetyltransferase [Chlorobium limicola]NTV20901.1 N-acetyltransferase [Chlorobium limicola]
MSEVRIHSTADVQSANIGGNTVIWQYSVVLPGAVIGRNCNINCHVFIENDVVIGDNVTIKSGVQVWDGMRIESNVFVGPNVTFINDTVPRSKVHVEVYTGSHIREGASIGANATILGGITIGEYAMIGAGSVVTHDVAPFTLWKGNPARQSGYVTTEGKILNMRLMDKHGVSYMFEDGKPVPKVKQDLVAATGCGLSVVAEPLH